MLCISPFSPRAAQALYKPALFTPLAPPPTSSLRPSTASIRTLCIRSLAPKPSFNNLSRPILTATKRTTTCPRLRPQLRTAATATAPSSPSPSPPPDSSPLTWNRFLALRKTRRRISLVSSIICGIGMAGVGFYIITTQDLDTMAANTTGLDPIIMIPLLTTGFVAIGWLVGPFFGNGVFGLVYRRLRSQIAQKEKEFYARIKRYRVDPSSSSIQNPVPDYYGEKIGSVADYRRWLKDQRAFNLKRGKNVV